MVATHLTQASQHVHGGHIGVKVGLQVGSDWVSAGL